jgi:hypothetical protein
LIAHVEVWLLDFYKLTPFDIKVPWNLDVSLITLAYLSIGYYGKKFISNITPKLTLFTTIISAWLITLNHYGFLNYHLDLKSLYYHNIFLDIFIPLIFCISLMGICKILDKQSIINKIFTFLGSASLIIMYFHHGINDVMLMVTDYGSLIYILVGIIPAVLILKYVFGRFTALRFLFLGER